MRGLIASTCATVTIGCVAWTLVQVRAPIPAAAIGAMAPEPAGVGGGPTTPIPENADVNANANANANADVNVTADVPHSAGVLMGLAWRAIESGDYDRANQQATECLAIDKTRSGCRSALVTSYTRRGLWDAAYPALSECMREDPQNPTCLSALVMTHVRRGAKDDAKRVLDLLVATGDRSADSQVAAAEYALISDDAAGACESFHAACAQSQAYACTRERELCNK